MWYFDGIQYFLWFFSCTFKNCLLSLLISCRFISKSWYIFWLVLSTYKVFFLSFLNEIPKFSISSLFLHIFSSMFPYIYWIRFWNFALSSLFHFCIYCIFLEITESFIANFMDFYLCLLKFLEFFDKVFFFLFYLTPKFRVLELCRHSSLEKNIYRSSELDDVLSIFVFVIWPSYMNFFLWLHI